MDNFDLKKYLAEGRLLKEDFEDFPNQKYYDLLNDLRDAGLLNKSGISGLQSKFNLSKEKAKEIFDEYLKDLEAEQPDAFDFFMKDLNEAFKVGDMVTLGGEGDKLKIIKARRMFGSNMMAYVVEFPDGREAEYAENQLKVS